MADDYPKVGTRGLNPGESILNPDGSRSSERTISFQIEKGGKHILIPTIVPDADGYLVKHSNENAIKLFHAGKNKAIASFDTPEEATEFAGKRSASGGRYQKTESSFDLPKKAKPAFPVEGRL